MLISDTKVTTLGDSINCTKRRDTQSVKTDVSGETSKVNKKVSTTDTGFNFVGTGLHFANLNIQHLIPKLEEIKFHLQKKNSPHFLGLCETFLTDNVHNDLLHINNYIIERRDRSHKKGGGLLVYIDANLTYKRRNDLETTDIESLWLEVSGKHCKSFLINFIYRPPNSSQTWIDMYDSQLEVVYTSNVEYYILGDVNIKYCSNPESYDNTKWSDLTMKYGIQQLVKMPTRVTNKTSTIIDHIYTNCSGNADNVYVPALSVSDHFPICFTRKKMYNNCFKLT